MATCDGLNQHSGQLSAAEIFRPLLVQIVTAGELVSSPKLKQILGEDASRALKRSKEGEEIKVKTILDLISQSEIDDKWETLADVLMDCDFMFVPKVLLKQYEEHMGSQLKRVIDALKDEELELTVLSEQLKMNNLLTDQDIQDIETESFNRDSKTAALLVLIDRVVTLSPESWYKRFCSCLHNIGMSDIVNKIEPDLGLTKDVCEITDEDNQPTDVGTDDHWRKLIMELCHGQIVRNVIPSGLLTNLGSVFSLDEKRTIRSIEKTDSRQGAMERLLDMLDSKDCPGKWQIFKQALVEDDYEWIKDFIEGDFVDYDQSSLWENLINLFEKILSEKVRPLEILPYIRQEKLISERDSQEVEQIYKNFGENEAVFRLLTVITKRKPNSWYPKFMEILYNNGSSDLVDKIDPDMYKKLLNEFGVGTANKGSCHKSDIAVSLTVEVDHTNLDDTDEKEAYVSVMEEVTKASNNMSSPNLNTEENIDEMTKEKMLAKSKVTYNSLSAERNTECVSQTNSEQIELNSLIVENVKRDIALEVIPTRAGLRNIMHSPYDTVKNDDQDSDTDNENIVKEELKLRSYQMELAEPALKGKNCIIVAPTGSGKTYVALKIIQHHMEKMKTNRFPKVAFVVGHSALAKQQADQCKKYLSQYRVKLITGEIQREAEVPKSLSSWLNRRDILVLTAQILVNAMNDNDIKIEDFTLMIFDECHHAHAKHSYTQIMHEYMDIKLDESVDRRKLPMVVGLTASVGVGKASTEKGAEDHIQKMMANLDAEELATVRKHLPELSEHVIVPEQEIVTTKARKKNYFAETIIQMMESTEQYMIESTYASVLPDKGGILKGPADKGSDPYTQWISKHWRETAKLNDQNARRFFETCRRYLDLYNKVLIIYEDARVKDAMKYLEDNLRRLNDGLNQDETDNKMMTIYEKGKQVLISCVERSDHINPKLEELKNIIFKLNRDKPDSRVIVFIKTRDLAQAIEAWMKETDGLSCLNPVKFVGSQAGGEKGGMTKNDQDEILKLFRNGGHKIIIATSVAEEGLDIQTCNLVIRYDHVTNEIAMVQARGRGRAEGSKFVVLASEKRGTAEKEEINLMREARMNDAIKKVQERLSRNKESFRHEVEKIQRVEKNKRDLEKLGKKRSMRNSEFVLRCGKCSSYICMSSDVKKIQDAHHAVINDEIRNTVTITRSTAKRIDSLTTCGAGKVKCKTCGQDLGSIIIHKNAEFPILKIECFIVADNAGKTNVYKKWKSVPFNPEPLLESDLENRLQGQPYLPD